MRVVISNFPGIKNFVKDNIKNANVRFVELPQFTNYKEISQNDLNNYEERIAKTIVESINDKNLTYADMSNVSWDKIANVILEG